jgi:hypothetical protein
VTLRAVGNNVTRTHSHWLFFSGQPDLLAATLPAQRFQKSWLGGFSVGFLVWLEATGLAEWVRSSIAGYPSMIALHALGMAIMVGLSLLLDLRILGWFAGIPLQALQRFFGLAWVGFGINFVSGSALFSAQATSYIVDWVFMTKMTLVLLGAITAGILQPAVIKAGPGGVSGGTKAVAAIAIVFWVVAIVMGRLTAYL